MSAVQEPQHSSMPPCQSDELRAFLMVLRQALLLVVGYIERRYNLARYRTPPQDIA